MGVHAPYSASAPFGRYALKVPAAIAEELGPTIAGWAAVIGARCDGRTGVTFAGLRTFAADAGRGLHAAQAATDQLLDAGWLEVYRVDERTGRRWLRAVWLTAVIHNTEIPPGEPVPLDGAPRTTGWRAPYHPVARPVPLRGTYQDQDQHPVHNQDQPAAELSDVYDGPTDVGRRLIAEARAALNGPRSQWRRRVHERVPDTTNATTLASSDRHNDRPGQRTQRSG